MFIFHTCPCKMQNKKCNGIWIPPDTYILIIYIVFEKSSFSILMLVKMGTDCIERFDQVLGVHSKSYSSFKKPESGSVTQL